MDVDGVDLVDKWYRHDFTADAGFALVVGVAGEDIAMDSSAALISRHLVAR